MTTMRRMLYLVLLQPPWLPLRPRLLILTKQPLTTLPLLFGKVFAGDVDPLLPYCLISGCDDWRITYFSYPPGLTLNLP